MKWQRLACALSAFFFTGAVQVAGDGAQAQQSTNHWLGWYAGGVAGYSWTDVEMSVAPFKSSGAYEGFLGGGVIGNNAWVTDRHLIGIEADLVLHDLAGDMSMSRHRLSLLGRFGRFATPSTLFFAVAGIAGGQYKAKVSSTVTTTQLVFDDDEVQIVVPMTTVTNSKRRKRLWGYTVGAGFEREGTLGNWDIRWGAEYRFTDFSQWNFSVAGQQFSIDPDVHDVRFRIVVPLNGNTGAPN